MTYANDWPEDFSPRSVAWRCRRYTEITGDLLREPPFTFDQCLTEIYAKPKRGMQGYVRIMKDVLEMEKAIRGGRHDDKASQEVVDRLMKNDTSLTHREVVATIDLRARSVWMRANAILGQKLRAKKGRIE